MCLICIEIGKEKLTPVEAFRNMCEMWDYLEKEQHLGEVYDKILNYEKEFKSKEVKKETTDLKEEGQNDEGDAD